MLFLLSAIAMADDTPYIVPITRKDVTHQMVAAPWWSGEYPMPIVDVTSKDGKSITVQGHASLRVFKDPTKACTIQQGLYHPWVKNASIERFYTLTGSVTYEVLVDFPDVELKKGDILVNQVYLGEGYCSYTLKSGKMQREISQFCAEGEQFKEVTMPTHPEEQWLYLNCQEGYKVFIQDTELLAQTGKREGRVCGYGVVSAQDKPCPESPE